MMIFNGLFRLFYLNNFVCISLFFVDVVVYDMGVIDDSILKAAWILLVFSVVEKIPKAIKTGKKLKIKKGDFAAEVSTDDD